MDSRPPGIIRACRYYLPELLTIDDLMFYVGGSAQLDYFQCAVYDDLDGVIGALLLVTDVIQIPRLGVWYRFIPEKRFASEPRWVWLAERHSGTQWNQGFYDTDALFENMMVVTGATESFPQTFPEIVATRMNTKLSIYANYTPGYPPAQFTLTIAAGLGGTTVPSPGSYSYNEGKQAIVEAFPNIGYLFDHWELDGVNVGSANPCSIIMDADHTLTAIFLAVPTHLLRVESTPIEGVPFTIEEV